MPAWEKEIGCCCVVWIKSHVLFFHISVLYLKYLSFWSHYLRFCSTFSALFSWYAVDNEEIARLGKRFRKLDKDSSGSLSVDEFMQLPELQQNPLVTRVIDIFDTDRNGEVDFKGRGVVKPKRIPEHSLTSSLCMHVYGCMESALQPQTIVLCIELSAQLLSMHDWSTKHWHNISACIIMFDVAHMVHVMAYAKSRHNALPEQTPTPPLFSGEVLVEG